MKELFADNFIDVFRELIVKYHVENVWSHQETWNNWTYQRDIKLKKLFRQKIFHGINHIKMV